MSEGQILTAAQMAAAEEALIARGVSADMLMRRAGQGAADYVWRVAAGSSITVLCGTGNNGGDGYVIAEVLRQRGANVQVVAPIEPKALAARNARAAWPGTTCCHAGGLSGGVFVDCLFGTGLSRPLAGDHNAMLASLHASHGLSIAVDQPSGADSDSGALLGELPSYALTLALGARKFAHWRMPAMERMGIRKLVPIGIETQDNVAQLIEQPDIVPPASDAHKYTRGLLAIVGGAMPGAGLLAAEAAMRSGAGYVRLFARYSHPAAPAGLVVDDGALGEALMDRRIDALLVGPGLGRNEEAQRRLSLALKRDLPTVLDGDALTLVRSGMIKHRKYPIIATPHEGELAMLCKSYEISNADKLERTSSLAAQSGMIVIAKGPGTVVCEPNGRVAISPDSPSWLSIAGSGDCLAGIVASRLAAGCSPFDSACQGVWLHSKAGQLAGPAFTADDLALSSRSAYAFCL